jgi:hypothetical protein
MTTQTQIELRRSDSIDNVKADVQHIEGLQEQWLQRFSLLQGKSAEELRGLQKPLLKKLDWCFLPSVTMMLPTAYESPPPRLCALLTVV